MTDNLNQCMYGIFLFTPYQISALFKMENPNFEDGVLVEVQCGSLQANLAVHDGESLKKILPSNKEAVRGILLNLAASRSLEEEDWTEALNNWPIEVTISSLHISYTCSVPLKKPALKIIAHSSTSNNTIKNNNTEVQEAYIQRPVQGATQPTKQQGTQQHENRQEMIVSVDHEPTEEEGSRIYHWGHNATKFLISKYSENKENFANKGIKKDLLWKRIADFLKENNFGKPTAQQVEDKFKNLRRSYAKIKDAMGPNCSGAPAPGSFKYFDEMDEIFKSNPSFTPALSVSNRRAHEVQVDVDARQVEEPPKKRARTAENLLKFTEQRHKDILEELRKTRQTLAEKLDKLIEKL